MVSKDSLWVKASIIIVISILLFVGAVVVLEAHQYYQKVPTSSYFEEGYFGVKEYLLPNLLYNQTSLDDPSIIYNSITDNVNISSDYSIQVDNMSGRNITVVNTVTLVSGAPSWNKVIYVNLTKQYIPEKGTITVPININMSKDLALANSIDNQLQDGNSVPTLTFNMSVQAQGLTPVVTSMQISLHGSYETVTYATPQPVTSTQFTNEKIVPHNFIGINKEFGYIFIGGAGVLVVYSAYLYIPRTSDPIERLKKDHGEQIIEITSPPLDSAIKVKKLDDLLKMSEIFEVPVFLYYADRVVYISHLGNQYYFEII